MSNILDNALIRKYFGCGKDKGNLHNHGMYLECDMEMAKHVLTAMQEPIRKGERYLFLWRDKGYIDDDRASGDILGWHVDSLRLPDRFQEAGKKECLNKYCGCPCHPDKTQPPPEPCSCWEMYHGKMICPCHCHETNIPKCLCGWVQGHGGVCMGIKPASPEKCELHQNISNATTNFPCSCKPGDAVEAKIKEIIDFVVIIGKDPSYTRINRVNDWLCEQVRLVREKK